MLSSLRYLPTPRSGHRSFHWATHVGFPNAGTLKLTSEWKHPTTPGTCAVTLVEDQARHYLDCVRIKFGHFQRLRQAPSHLLLGHPLQAFRLVNEPFNSPDQRESNRSGINPTLTGSRMRSPWLQVSRTQRGLASGTLPVKRCPRHLPGRPPGSQG